MFRWVIPFVLVLYKSAISVGAQTPARPPDPVFVRAQELVSDGNGAAGRALVDSVLRVNSPTSQIYPQALYWRASLASNAADAESDYKHIVVDYPLAPQAEEALLRLAQLELARGDKEGALGHLQRIPRDYPHSRSLARASYWIARVLFEKNDVPKACAANANALAQLTAGEIELQNQIQYQGQRCTAYNAARSAATAPSTSSAAGTPTQPAVAASSTVTTLPPAAAPVVSASSTQPVVSKPVEATAIASDSVPEAPSALPRVPSQTVRPKPPADARDTHPSIVDPSKRPAGLPVKTDETSKPIRPVMYSVQVAAYTRKADAQTMVATLTKRGYEARVDGDVAPFRVRIGRYSTAGEAEAALTKIKARQMEGFVVRAPER